MTAECPPATEIIYQISEAEQIHLLKKNFHDIYQVAVDYHYVQNAIHQKQDSLDHYFSGLPLINFNAVIGSIDDPEKMEAQIAKECKFFGNTPFFWYVDENASVQFLETLKKHGFVDIGIMQGVIGPIDPSIKPTHIPKGFSLEKVQDEKNMKELTDLVCEVFEVAGPAKKAFHEMLWSLAQGKQAKWHHWVARKEGRVVSAVSTMIDGGIVSFSNGASAQDIRKLGINTALRRLALQHAVKQGAKFGSSYLSTDALAFGICSKLGFQTKWRFHAFISPPFSE